MGYILLIILNYKTKGIYVPTNKEVSFYSLHQLEEATPRFTLPFLIKSLFEMEKELNCIKVNFQAYSKYVKW